MTDSKISHSLLVWTPVRHLDPLFRCRPLQQNPQRDHLSTWVRRFSWLLAPSPPAQNPKPSGISRLGCLRHLKKSHSQPKDCYRPTYPATHHSHTTSDLAYLLVLCPLRTRPPRDDSYQGQLRSVIRLVESDFKKPLLPFSTLPPCRIYAFTSIAQWLQFPYLA